MLELPLQLVTGSLQRQDPRFPAACLSEAQGLHITASKERSSSSSADDGVPRTTSAETNLGRERRGSWQKERKKLKFRLGLVFSGTAQ